MKKKARQFLSSDLDALTLGFSVRIITDVDHFVPYRCQHCYFFFSSIDITVYMLVISFVLLMNNVCTIFYVSRHLFKLCTIHSDLFVTFHRLSGSFVTSFEIFETCWNLIEISLEIFRSFIEPNLLLTSEKFVSFFFFFN